MEAGALVWCRDTEGDEAWILSEVISKTATELKVFAVNNTSNIFSRPRVKNEEDNDEEGIVAIRYEGVELANARLSDEDRAEGKDDDLITLPHLHEPALLHAVEERFMHDKIYTWTGPVLIAVNPFIRLPLYTQVSFTISFQQIRHIYINPSNTYPPYLSAGNFGSIQKRRFIEIPKHTSD